MHTVQNVENFYGNVKNVTLNTYYNIDPYVGRLTKAAIRDCLENSADHPDVPPVLDPYWKETKRKSIYTQYKEDLWEPGIDDLKHPHRNTSGPYADVD